MTTLKLEFLSERFAHTQQLASDGKPLCQAFGVIVESGSFRPGLLYCKDRVRKKMLTFELYEPNEKLEPVLLGKVTVKLKNHLKPCGDGQMHTDLELEVLDAE